MFFYAVAMSYLELGKDDMFLSVINKLKVKEEKSSNIML